VGARKRVPEFFADVIGDIQDEAEYYRIAFSLRHRGQDDEPVVEITLTPSAYEQLAKKLTLGTRRRMS